MDFSETKNNTFEEKTELRLKIEYKFEEKQKVFFTFYQYFCTTRH